MSDPIGFQGIRWQYWVDKLKSTSTQLKHTRGDVSSRLPDGGQQGYHPAAMRGIATPTVPEEPHVPTVYPDVAHRGRRFRLFPDWHGAAEGFTPPESSDAVWFGGSDDLTPGYKRFQAGRHTQFPLMQNATNASWGSSPCRSGPEGTLVIYPPHMPRLMGQARRVVSGNTMNRTPVQRVGTPQISVTQAAGWYP